VRVAGTFLRIVRFFRRPTVFDRTLVILLSVIPVIGTVALAMQGETALALGSALQAAGTPILLVRRSRPIYPVSVFTAIDAVFTLTTTSPLPAQLPTLIAFYSLGRYTSGRATAISFAATYALAAAATEVAKPGMYFWVPLLFVFGLLVGWGQLIRLRAELRERATREAADAAVRAERRRIARELHDVVAHHITVINALVGGARATLPPEQEVTREALESAEQTARQAMTEMRRLLDVLRADGTEGPDAATGVGAARLPALIKEARAAGLPAGLTVTGEPVELPAAVDHAVYRIVQEALTNTRKHAAGARASVRLTYEPQAVEVEVLDDGLATDGGAPGFGLGGMAERVALCGGRLTTGPRPEGGFRVHARIPLENA
jgi:signal transduction histidine kinase